MPNVDLTPPAAPNMNLSMSEPEPLAGAKPGSTCNESLAASTGTATRPVPPLLDALSSFTHHSGPWLDVACPQPPVLQGVQACMSRCHREGRRFESVHPLHHSSHLRCSTRRMARRTWLDWLAGTQGHACLNRNQVWRRVCTARFGVRVRSLYIIGTRPGSGPVCRERTPSTWTASPSTTSRPGSSRTRIAGRRPSGCRAASRWPTRA